MSDQAPAQFLPTSLNDWLESLAKVVLVAATLIGGFWAYFEYMHKEQQRRVEQTLAYVKRFSEGVVFEASTRIGSVWYANYDRLQNLASTPPSPEKEFKDRHRQLVMTVVERGIWEASDGKRGRGLVQEIDAVTAFFSELKVCIDAQLCDDGTARVYFGDYARRFYCLHEPYISWKASAFSAGFGQQLAGFALIDAKPCRPH